MIILKKILLTIICILIITINIYCKKNNILSVKRIILDNGLTVYLNEDHNKPEVFGSVVVKAGSKYDPKDSTGIAHYLEHMLFKGTRDLGTTDYKKEKPYLDEINKLYDQLALIKKLDERTKIQNRINELSIEAGKYAISNEFVKLIQSIGGEYINATTYWEKIIYYNSFPPQEINKWLDIYSHRFINPVFRLFQSELETVYEEKNRAMDNFLFQIYENAIKYFFKNHPYRQSILGETDHLKNPSLTRMYEYYNTYYVANNMALILTGDFDSTKIIPVIKEKFGKLKNVIVPKFPVYKEDDFNGRELVVKHLSPTNIGFIAFRTIPNNHPDSYALELCNYLLNNQNNTGFLDKLKFDNKLFEIGSILWLNNDHGGNLFYYVPKIIGQTLESGEKLVLYEINKIKNGEFTDDSLKIAKYNLIKNFEEELENIVDRNFNISDCFIHDKEWDDILSYPEKINKLTRQDIINVSNKYFSKNYLCFYSKMGTAKKEKLKKPGYKPISTSLNGKSKYAKYFENIQPYQYKPNFIDFKNNVKIIDLKNKVRLFYSSNPVNNIFSLEIKYGAGKFKLPLIWYATRQMNDLGTNKLSQNDFKSEMEKICCEYNIESNNSYTIIKISGAEENLESCIKLINTLLNNPEPDQKRLDFVLKNDKLFRMFAEKKDPRTVGDALKKYIIYRDLSDYLYRPSLTELTRIKSEDLIKEFKKALKYKMTIFYTGKKNPESVKNIIINNLNIQDNLIESDSPVVPETINYDRNTIFFVNKSDARQSQIYFYIKGNNYNLNDFTNIKAFNDYFGSGMYSIVFQEIRESRSLAYNSYANYLIPERINKNCYLLGFLGTQDDKTVEAVEIMKNLIENMPIKEEKFDVVKNNLIKRSYIARPDFRDVPYYVETYIRFGFNKDPNEEYINKYHNMTFNDIIKFYNNNIKHKPLVICIVGNKNRINIKQLEKFGKLIILNQNKLFKN